MELNSIGQPGRRVVRQCKKTIKITRRIAE
nr:MAG TPA: hypothetical protein [Caudoviricetes sp.]